VLVPLNESNCSPELVFWHKYTLDMMGFYLQHWYEFGMLTSNCTIYALQLIKMIHVHIINLKTYPADMDLKLHV
jgi:hypothetical protein